MAEKRMFTKKVTDDDNFMSLSSSAQALYLHLSMSADDDGFCNQVNTAMFKAHASVQDIEALLEKRYIYQFEDGVIVIKHWRMANALRKDRYTPTAFRDDMAKLKLKSNGVYTMHPNEGEPLLPEEAKPAETPTARMLAYQRSSLPYSFDYKIRNAFFGKPCPVCCAAMKQNRDEDGIITKNHMATIQHNIPISMGGAHELGNISVICHECNVRIQDTPTGELNAAEVAEVWEKIVGCRLVAVDKNSIDKNSVDKSSVERQPLDAFAEREDDAELTDAIGAWVLEIANAGKPLTAEEQKAIIEKLSTIPHDEWLPNIRRSTEKGWRNVYPRKEDKKVSAQKKQRDKWSEPVPAEETERLLRLTREMQDGG